MHLMNFGNNVYRDELYKKASLYEIQSIHNAIIVTLPANTEEYWEKIRNKDSNKNHKGLRKDVKGKNFESYANIILSFSEIYNNNFNELEKPKKLIQIRSSIKWGFIAHFLTPNFTPKILMHKIPTPNPHT